MIGQVFSYAAGLWRLGYEELEQAFAARDADLTAPFTNDPDWDEAVFRDAVAENLAKGAFRLVIAVDEITDELKRTVVYINRHTVPELRLLALELRYAVDEGVEILLPEVYGEESAEREGSWSVKRQWDEASFLEELEAKRGPAEAQVARELIEWARVQLPRFTWGTGMVDWIVLPGARPCRPGLLALLALDQRRVEIEFERLRRRPPFDDVGLRREFLRRLNEIPGCRSRKTRSRVFRASGSPSLPPARRRSIPSRRALDWFCETVRSDAEDHAED